MLIKQDNTPKPRETCSIAGCSNLVMYKGHTASGRQRFHNLCRKHYLTRCSERKSQPYENHRPCELCGWSASYCDRYRAGSRVKDRSALFILCPNCYRLAYTNAIDLVRKLDGTVKLRDPKGLVCYISGRSEGLVNALRELPKSISEASDPSLRGVSDNLEEPTP